MFVVHYAFWLFLQVQCRPLGLCYDNGTMHEVHVQPGVFIKGHLKFSTIIVCGDLYAQR